MSLNKLNIRRYNNCFSWLSLQPHLTQIFLALDILATLQYFNLGCDTLPLQKWHITLWHPIYYRGFWVTHKKLCQILECYYSQLIVFFYCCCLFFYVGIKWLKRCIGYLCFVTEQFDGNAQGLIELLLCVWHCDQVKDKKIFIMHKMEEFFLCQCLNGPHDIGLK